MQQLAHEAKLAKEKEEEGGSENEGEKHEEDESATAIDNNEHRKSAAKTPGDIEEPMRVRLTRKFIEAV